MKKQTPFRERVWQFMQGRNGVDALYNFLLIVCLFLIIIAIFLQGIPKLIVGATVVSFATTLPELLVSAFVSGDWKKIYDYALANDFRFLSYGDSSLLIP